MTCTRRIVVDDLLLKFLFLHLQLYATIILFFNEEENISDDCCGGCRMNKILKLKPIFY